MMLRLSGIKEGAALLGMEERKNRLKLLVCTEGRQGAVKGPWKGATEVSWKGAWHDLRLAFGSILERRQGRVLAFSANDRRRHLRSANPRCREWMARFRIAAKADRSLR